MELVRRLVLVGCFLTAGVLAYTASLSPLISVRFIDFAERLDRDIKAARALLDISKGDKERYAKFAGQYERLSKMPLSIYIDEYFEGKDEKLVKADSGELEIFFQDVIAVSRGRITDRQWTKRFPSERHHLKDLFFRADEPEAIKLSGYFKGDSKTFYMISDKSGEPAYFEIRVHEYSDSDFQIGSGFLPYPDPPSRLLYPYRQLGLLLAAAGMAFYIFLPRPRKGKDAAGYGSIGIGLKNGSTVYINLTNAMGGVVLKEAGAIVQSLKNAGVKERAEIKVIRSMGLEPILMGD